MYIQLPTSGAGAALGGTAGGGIAASGTDNIAVIVAGVIGGIVIGEYLEGQANIKNATEYVIETNSGVLLTVAQIDEGNKIFSENDKVILIYGFPNRLIKNPR